MPRRKKRHTVRAQQRAEAEAAKHQKESKTSQSKRKQRRECAQPSHEIPPDSSPPTLGTLFANLLPELRAEIFAWLLVRPVKWTATHMTDCPLRSPKLTATPFQDIHPRLGSSGETCVKRAQSARSWRRRVRPIWRDPWRSEWAPPITNEFLCSQCWDSEYHPDYDRLCYVCVPCLCARKRRAGGFAALLVCQAWYEEAARVFYSRNTFAFVSPEECIFFFEQLDPRWSALVSKVSLMACGPQRFAHKVLWDWAHVIAMRKAWVFLEKLSALSELELDALFLDDPKCVSLFESSPLRNLRKINFMQPMPIEPATAPREFVWPRKALQKEVDYNESITDIARRIKGLTCD
ncbi:hypothetical protein F4802DRAFT_599009 [Xylaria palmicola]|nr:hypothetical protein F4802DRAFT_599009 [Xylaria palmicola]